MSADFLFDSLVVARCCWALLTFQAIMVEEDRVVCLRFGHDHNSDCMAMDETLYGVSEKVQNFCVIYLGE